MSRPAPRGGAPVSTGQSSRNMEMVTALPMNIDEPDMSESMALPIWSAMTMPVKKRVMAVTGIDL